MSVIATIECQESYCNAANLSCYDCNKCDKSSISKQVKICTGLNETSCYVRSHVCSSGLILKL